MVSKYSMNIALGNLYVLARTIDVFMFMKEIEKEMSASPMLNTVYWGRTSDVWSATEPMLEA